MTTDYLEDRLLSRTRLVQRISEVCGLSRRDSKVVLECMLSAIIEALQKGDTVYIRKFGTFNTRMRSPRPSRNPVTGARVVTPAKKVARFKASRELLRMVAGALDEMAGAADEPEPEFALAWYEAMQAQSNSV